MQISPIKDPAGDYRPPVNIRRIVIAVILAALLAAMLAGCASTRKAVEYKIGTVLSYTPGKMVLISGRDTLYVAESFTRKNVAAGQRFRIIYDTTRSRIIQGRVHYYSFLKRIK